mmetsp:Transcript_84312/g.263428  ORF Transcript_84312/g.263428 Transcript_84312/m.263428 type:complete len:349 (-) Transcript_84312:1260-2306(-)
MSWRPGSRPRPRKQPADAQTHPLQLRGGGRGRWRRLHADTAKVKFGLTAPPARPEQEQAAAQAALLGLLPRQRERGAAQAAGRRHAARDIARGRGPQVWHTHGGPGRGRADGHACQKHRVGGQGRRNARTHTLRVERDAPQGSSQRARGRAAGTRCCGSGGLSGRRPRACGARMPPAAAPADQGGDLGELERPTLLHPGCEVVHVLLGRGRTPRSLGRRRGLVGEALREPHEDLEERAREAAGLRALDEQQLHQPAKLARLGHQQAQGLCLEANGPEPLGPAGARVQLVQGGQEVAARHLQTRADHELDVLQGLHERTLQPPKLLRGGVPCEEGVHRVGGAPRAASPQ